MIDPDELEEFNNSSTSKTAYPAIRMTWEEKDIEANEERDSNNINAQMWAVYGNKFSPCETAVSKLQPGQYTIEQNANIGIYFNKKTVNLDELFVLPDSASEDVLKQIESFWEKEDHFRKFGFLWKRGIMLWGPPGSGKTSTLQLVSNQIIQRGGIAVYVSNPGLAAHGLELLRSIEPSRPLVVMLEDIDAIVRDYGESQLLALLDGELQIDNVVFVATTNYPEDLDKRLKNRPSRFDYVKKIGMPSADARRLYLANKNPRLDADNSEMEKWVELTNGFSVAHLKELIVSVEVFEVPVDDAAKRLRLMMDTNISSFQNEESSIGFIK